MQSTQDLHYLQNRGMFLVPSDPPYLHGLTVLLSHKYRYFYRLALNSLNYFTETWDELMGGGGLNLTTSEDSQPMISYWLVSHCKINNKRVIVFQNEANFSPRKAYL